MEMQKYCKADVEVLSRSILAFRQLFHKHLDVDPFRYVTLASLCMAIYINKFLPDKSIVCNDSNKPISKISREWFYYLNNKNIQREKLITVNNSDGVMYDRQKYYYDSKLKKLGRRYYLKSKDIFPVFEDKPHSICKTVEEFKDALKLSRNWYQKFNKFNEEE